MATNTRHKPPGRNSLPPGKANNISYPVSLSAELLDRLKANKEKTDKPVATQIRKAIEGYLAGSLIEDAPTPISLPVVGSSVCGPLEEAITNTEDRLWIDERTRRLLQIDEEDIVVRSYGQSMTGAGIIDGDYVIMTPLAEHARPKSGEIALTQVFTSDGTCTSTLKFWHWRGDKPYLKDADDNEVPLPDDVESIEAIAVARARIGRI